MSGNYHSQDLENRQGLLFGVLVVLFAFVGGCWFMAYHAYTTTPATETITVTLPAEMIASKGLAEPAETIEIERVKPWRESFSALLHPFGYIILMLLVTVVGGLLIFLANSRGQCR